MKKIGSFCLGFFFGFVVISVAGRMLEWERHTFLANESASSSAVELHTEEAVQPATEGRD